MTHGGTSPERHDCELGCGRPAKGTTLCRECTEAWAGDLVQVDDLAADLALVLSRQTRYSPPAGGGRSAEAPVPFDARVAGAARDARATMRRVAAAAGMPAAGGASTSAVCAWLRPRVWVLAKGPDAADMAEATQVTVERLRRVCDRPVERVYLGRCRGARSHTAASAASPCQCACHTAGASWRPACDVPGGCGHLHSNGDPASPPAAAGCGAELYVAPGEQFVDCAACGATVDVAAQHEYLLVVMRDQLAAASEIARAVSRYREPMKADRVRQWARRGLLERRGTDRRGDPTYRVGDVLDLLERDADRRRAGAAS